MFRSLLAMLLLLALASSIDAAKRKKRAARKANAKTEEVAAKAKKTEPEKEAPEKAEEAQPSAAKSEMEVYRAIQKRNECTVQDLVDLTLMYRGEFAKINTAEKRVERVRELKIIKAQKGNDPLERGTLAYALMKIYAPESGILFWLTGWERYAMRDVQEAGIMPTKATPAQHISGEQLMGTITAAEEYREGRKNWGTK
jgi:hypothetical protein